MDAKPRASERLMRAYLLLVAVLLVPIALSYGIAPARVLPKLSGHQSRGQRPDPDLSRADVPLSCRVDILGDRRIQAGLAARRGDLGNVLRACRWRLGGSISLVVDGPASRLLDLYLALEIFGGLLGLAVLAYARRSAA